MLILPFQSSLADDFFCLLHRFPYKFISTLSPRHRDILTHRSFTQKNTGWNDKIVALEKTIWFHFRLMKTGFLFCCIPSTSWPVCTNTKSDRSLLSCLKVTQCSTSEIKEAPLYNSCTLSIQVMTTGPMPAPSKCKSGRFKVPRMMKTKFTFWSGFKWGPHHATSYLRSRL